VQKPTINSPQSELIKFVHDWVKLCSLGNVIEAFEILDSPIDPSNHTWTAEDLREISFDHFDDGKQPEITDPDTVDGTIYSDVFEYNDFSGWGVEYNLPMNGVVSDFTLMFDFIKSEDVLKIILTDCHIM